MAILTKEERSAIASYTLEILGGTGRLKAMINARHFTYDKQGSLIFHFSGCRKANIVKFSLNGKDLYDIEFMKYNNRTLEIKQVVKFKDLYFDQLPEVFESFTGLYLTL